MDIEKALFLSSAGVLAAGTAASAFVATHKHRARSLSLAPGAVLLTIALAYRWRLTGHPPVFGTFEASAADAWACALVAIATAFVWPRIKWIQPIGGALAVGMLAFGMRFTAKHYPLTISETSLWVDFHATQAWAAFGLYACSTAAAFVSLAKKATDESDDAAYRLAELGFIFHSTLIMSGSYYASILMAEYWQWDVVESASLLSWLFYGFVLHLRPLFGYRGRKLAVWLILAFAALVVSYKLPAYAWSFTYHFFDLNL